jgi:hypothetical protein
MYLLFLVVVMAVINHNNSLLVVEVVEVVEDLDFLQQIVAVNFLVILQHLEIQLSLLVTFKLFQ